MTFDRLVSYLAITALSAGFVVANRIEGWSLGMVLRLVVIAILACVFIWRAEHAAVVGEKEDE